MIMRKLNTLKIMTALLFAVIVLMPAGAWAAGDIFTIISAKMISTVKDVRQIVYVIAGFGLIMFAFLAIFNKISFKHLGYIMIGLSLLAVMMPFIDYFSGAQLETEAERQVRYGDFIKGENASVVGSDLRTAANCTGDDCPSLSGPGKDELMGDLESEMGAMGGGPSLIDNKTAWDSNGCRTVTSGGKSSQECCEGKLKNGKCKKTTKQLLGSIVNGAKTAINAGKAAVSAVNHGKDAYNKAKDGIERVGDIIASGDGNFFDKLGGISDAVNAIGSTGSDVAWELRQGLNDAEHSMNHTSDLGKQISENYEKNPTGENKFSDRLDNSKVHDAADKVRDKLDKATNEVSDYTNMGSDTADAAKDSVDLGKDIGSWFGGKK